MTLRIGGAEKTLNGTSLRVSFGVFFAPGDVPPLAPEFTRETGEDRQRYKCFRQKIFIAVVVRAARPWCRASRFGSGMQSPIEKQGKRLRSRPARRAARRGVIRCILSAAKKVSYIPCVCKMTKSRAHWAWKLRHAAGVLVEREATLKQSACGRNCNDLCDRRLRQLTYRYGALNGTLERTVRQWQK